MKMKRKIIWIGAFIPIALYLMLLSNSEFKQALYDQIVGVYSVLTNQNRLLIDNGSFVLLDFIIFCMVFGVVVTLAFYQLVLFIRIKERKYLFSTLFVLFLLFHQTVESGILSTVSIKVDRLLFSNMDVFTNLFIMTLVAFTCSVLDTSSKIPSWHKIIRIFLFLPLGNLVFWVFNMDFLLRIMTYLLLMVEGIMIGTVSIFYIVDKDKKAMLFFTAMVVLFSGFILEMVYTDISLNIFFVAATIASILLINVVTEQLFFMYDKNLELQQVEHSLTQLSLTDELSQLYNKRFLNTKLKHEVKNAHKTGKPLSLVLLDIDHFKRYNDTYGHQEGDKAIIKLGRLMKESIRDTDYACRFGGEEFALILTGTNKYAAEKHVAERLHLSLSRQVFMITRDSKVFLTVSMGISQLQKEESANTLIKHADKALYKAKELGKNRTVLYREGL